MLDGESTGIEAPFEVAADSVDDVVLAPVNIWSALWPQDDSSSRFVVAAPSRRSHSSNSLADRVLIPPAHIHLFRATSHVTLTLGQPITLKEAVISPLSEHAHLATSSDAFLDSTIFSENIILRQGSVLTFPHAALGMNGNASESSPTPLRYRVEMMEPVLQGRAVKGQTRLVVLQPDEADLDEPTNHGANFEDEDDGFEIDEAFLGNTISASQSSASAGVNDVTLNSNGFLHHNSVFTAVPLDAPASEDDDVTIYVRTSDLGRVGVLNGDWGITQAAGGKRLVKITSHEAMSPNGEAHASPVLLHNAGVRTSDSQLTLLSSPFGPSHPPIPTARSVTISRVGSPISINKQYQSQYLGKLKQYFEERKRLVKKGDMIALAIDTNAARTQQDSEEELEGVADERIANSGNAIVFFVITNVEHDAVPGAVQSGAGAQDVYAAATYGELGCWIDPGVTRMVQSGVDHAYVPAVEGYVLSESGQRPALPRSVEGGDSPLTSPASPYGQLLDVVSVIHSRRAVDLDLNLSILLKGSRGCGKQTTVSWIAQRMGMHLMEVNCYDLLGDNDAQTQGIMRARFAQAAECSPCVLLLRHVDALAQNAQVQESGKEPAIVNVLRECMAEAHQAWRVTEYPVVVVGTTSEAGQVPMGVLSCFKHEIAFEAPDEATRLAMLEVLTSDLPISPDVSIAHLAQQTAALVAANLVDLVRHAKAAAVGRTMGATGADAPSLIASGISLTAQDFDLALNKVRASYSTKVGAPKIPNVTWDDVGGLADVKADILDTIQLPLDHPELFASGMKQRSGILLYGPPGTGKTLLAKAVATSCSLNFFSVKGPELLNMYIGESEANVRRVFQRARDARPCVVFFDELDSIAPKRGNHGDSGGVMDRIVSQLLAELDGMAGGGADVFVIGATNRPDLLDPALLRPGRFDRMLYLGVSDTHEAQLRILEALTRKFKLDSTLDLRAIAEKCPFNYTGADFYALCSDAMLNAMSRKAEELEEVIASLNQKGPLPDHPYPLTPQYYLAELASPKEIEVLVRSEDFEVALRNLVPSVSQAEMEHYREVQKRFSQVDS
ncbi:AAA-domain-containing protein [Schizophyllum commune H4-8]|uniref:AAA-domain-containing protein n=1 Tax=Schizophyllum commune (strain H4-8 / FGSC 9210) TaxID=578458 RepID=UPI00215F15D7|nr:AAA-domain-containing protein [Schizophyllum commune H4-8]KAI5900026.1 AAA-domain-containing protein [Schizophyllum commune H4-8]